MLAPVITPKPALCAVQQVVPGLLKCGVFMASNASARTLQFHVLVEFHRLGKRQVEVDDARTPYISGDRGAINVVGRVIGEASHVEPLKALRGGQTIRPVDDSGVRSAGRVVVGPVVEARVQAAVVAGAVGDHQRHAVLDGGDPADLPPAQQQINRVRGVAHEVPALSKRKFVDEAADEEVWNVGRRSSCPRRGCTGPDSAGERRRSCRRFPSTRCRTRAFPTRARGAWCISPGANCNWSSRWNRAR